MTHEVPTHEAESPWNEVDILHKILDDRLYDAQWAISDEDKARYDQVFATLTVVGYVNGLRPAEILGVPQNEYEMAFVLLKYEQVFATLQQDAGGSSTGLSVDILDATLQQDARVRPVLERSGLTVDILRTVWNLSDINSDGHLDAGEFAVAMHLCREATWGEPLPPTLPPNLVPPSKRPRKVSSRTAADGAAEEEFLRVLGTFDKDAPEVKHRNGDGWTVLMKIARYHDWPEAAAALIDLGCPVDEDDAVAPYTGWTALSFAASQDHRKTVRVLLEKGASRDVIYGTSTDDSLTDGVRGILWEAEREAKRKAEAKKAKEREAERKAEAKKAKEWERTADTLALLNGHFH